MNGFTVETAPLLYFTEHVMNRRQGKPYDIRPRAIDPFHEPGAEALDRISASFAHRLAGCDVPADL
jgi:hypothetical protein